MRTPDPRRLQGTARGFTLPAILVIAGALLILAVGALLITGIERGTARSFADRQRAELAARSGLEEIRGILTKESANDDYIIQQAFLTDPTTSGRDKSPYLFLTRAKADATSLSYRHVPLVSTIKAPAKTTLQPDQMETLLGATELERTELTTLPYQDKVRAAWLTLQDAKGRTIARYAYWVEDLQGRIDPAVAGNDRGAGSTHARLAWPFPAPGLADLPATPSEDGNNQVALYAVDPVADEAQQGTAGKNLLKNRALLVSPESSLAAAGIAPPLAREANGHLTDPKARALEESLSPGLPPYDEQPLIPHADGIALAVAGQPKLNLNKLLTKDRNSAVNEMADFIKKALTTFETRKGGFPEDYLKTLAANALDYADADGEPSVVNGSYRGLDSYPLVSEFLMRFRWERVFEEGGRKYLELSASTYVELWNMSDKETRGDAEVSFETKYKFPLGANPEVTLDDISVATPKPVEKDGYRWFPPIKGIVLKPNEYLLKKCGTITYKIDAGPASFFIPSPLVLEGETFGDSKAGYRLKWNGKLVDQSRGAIHRNNSSLNYPTDTTSKPSQRTRTTIPAHSMSRRGTFRNNMGDCRMSYYYDVAQDANVYPDNYSPNRRNIRWGTIYSGDAPTKTKVYGRVMPSEWPDGGHNSSYDSNSFYTTDERVLPDDARFFPGTSSILRNPPKEESPMRISNLGRFYSATELGRVYDPIMWEVAMPAGPNLPWGDVLTSTTASSDFGGGNTLRIGRPEHPRFNQPIKPEPALEAWRLLDLFHAGIGNSSVSADREGAVRRIAGHVNLNTANREVLRALAVGALVMDPKMSIRTSESHETTSKMAPPITPYKLTPAEINQEANRIADAIILARKTAPFTSNASIAEVMDASGKQVFGNKDLLPNNKGPQVHRTDSAAEEIFARVYESTTVRSRNFRIWVIGQAVAPTTLTTAKPEVLAEVRRCFTVFANPGKRNSDGSIDPSTTGLQILHENDF